MIAFLTNINRQVVLLIESIVLSVLFLAVLYDLVFYLGTVLSNPKVKVTSKQKTMLGISQDVTGFQTISTPIRPTTTTSTPKNSTKTTPPVTTPFTPTHYHHYSPTTSFSTPRYSPNNSSYIMYCTPSSSPSSSFNNKSSSPFTSDRISSINSLEEYLRSEEEKEQKFLHSSPGDVQGYWSPSGSTLSLRKYHVATRNVVPLEKDQQETSSLWARLGIRKDEVNEWTERCRKWLAQTIINPISKEIKLINKKLEDMGSKKLTLGVATLEQLQDVASLRTMALPSLSMLTHYLKVCTKQDYLIKRIHELAEGSTLSNYKWDGGGPWKGRKWDQDLPNDSQLVLHFLCTYLDSQIPPSPQFPDGKTFTAQYFLKTPDKPKNKKSTLAIYQSSMYPPHYKVLWKDSCIEIPHGRNNLFYAIIVFLHYIKKEEKGLLGHLDLELSGLNLLWIIADKK